MTFLVGEVLCNEEEDGCIARRVHDDQHRDNYFAEQIHMLRLLATVIYIDLKRL
jgi:hypothetical protein